jgi:hypothetical protein
MAVTVSDEPDPRARAHAAAHEIGVKAASQMMEDGRAANLSWKDMLVAAEAVLTVTLVVCVGDTMPDGQPMDSRETRRFVRTVIRNMGRQVRRRTEETLREADSDGG